ncbi:MAG: 16S rRNA (guanine(527)-N(7))-methyltransferase RsmG [Spirochaetales bacterium]
MKTGMELLYDGAFRLGWDLTDEQMRMFEVYLSEIELWNAKINLVGASGDELIKKHVIDSLSGAKPLLACLGRDPGVIEDAGTGAGFPGIPLAVVIPQFEVLLVERSGKRAGFLRNALARMKLPNARVIEGDAFELDLQPHGLVYRAFVPISRERLEHLGRKVSQGGWLLLYRGKQLYAEEEIDQARQSMVFSQSALLPIRVPYIDDDRHLVTLKRASTVP